MSDPELMSNDPDVSANVPTDLAKPNTWNGPSDGSATQPFPELTSRERLVAMALSRGLKNREIGAELGISTKTIDTHRGHVLKKLKLRNNVELCLLAVRNGWLIP